MAATGNPRYSPQIGLKIYEKRTLKRGEITDVKNITSKLKKTNL